MSGSGKGSSFLDPPRKTPPHKQLDYELHGHIAPELQNRSVPRNPSPLKLPQRRKFFMLSMHNSADSDVDSSRNSLASDTEIVNQHLAQKQYQEAMDLRAIIADETVDMAMEVGSCSLAGEEQILERKKLLAQLTRMNPGVAGRSKAFYESSEAVHDSLKHAQESSVIAQSNPCRICRFCGREFPSGRALGGHMRVHGALLDAQLSTMKQENRSQHEGNQQYAGKQNHEEKLVSKALNSVVSGTAPDLSSPEGCDDQEEVSEKSTEDSEEGAGYALMKSIHEKLDASCFTQRNQEEEGEERGDLLDVSYLEYSDGYGLAGKMDITHIGIENISKKHGALYELRRNPKPNQRFMNKEEQYRVAQITYPFNANCRSNPSAQQLPSPIEDMGSHRLESVHPCSECGKVFPSWKSLFGHMRCHPEREWRGIQRPDSGGELDRTKTFARRSASADGSVELCFDQAHNNNNKSNCTMKVEIKEEIGHSNAMDCKEVRADHNRSKCMTTKGLSDSLAEEKGASLTSGESRMWSRAKQEALVSDLGCTTLRHYEGDQGNKIQCSDNKLQESMLHSPLEEMTDDWTPRWACTPRQRSKRRRPISHLHTEPALTSEDTTSNEIKADQKRHDASEYEDDLVDPANCLVLLSKSMPIEVNKSSMESTEESALSHDFNKVRRRALANVGQMKREWNGIVNNLMHAQNDHGAEDHNRVGVNGGDDDDDDGDDQADNNGSGHLASTVSIKYQCSTCKKCFNSHQALGGHRASHRKMKGCFARMKSLAAYDAQESSEENNTDEPEYNILSSERKKGQAMKHILPQEEKASACKDFTDKATKKKFKGHECSICHRVFVTGQALGGHKRCHWTGEKAPAGAGDAASVASSSTENRQQTAVQDRDDWGCRSKSMAKEDVFDLNLPAPLDEDDEVGYNAVPYCGASNMVAKSMPPLWKQQEWNPTKVAHIPQVCSVKTL